MRRPTVCYSDNEGVWRISIPSAASERRPHAVAAACIIYRQESYSACFIYYSRSLGWSFQSAPGDERIGMKR